MLMLIIIKFIDGLHPHPIFIAIEINKLPLKTFIIFYILKSGTAFKKKEEGRIGSIFFSRISMLKLVR